MSDRIEVYHIEKWYNKKAMIKIKRWKIDKQTVKMVLRRNEEKTTVRQW